MIRTKTLLSSVTTGSLLKNFSPSFSGAFISRAHYSSEVPSYNFVKIEKKANGVALIQLNRPKALNALCKDLCSELGDAFTKLEKDSSVRVYVLTGNEKSFAAGADIKEMKELGFSEVYETNLFGSLDSIPRARKPIIAAVNGFALGGGCELAMMCDIIIAGENARFGQPEVKIGTVPGIGGTQRLTRLIGRVRAMEWVLTGDMYNALDAEKAGLVSRVVPSDKLLDEALSMASKIASYSQPVINLAKECVETAEETGLTEGLSFEKRVFQSTFAIEDRKEGMTAFTEKRSPSFQDR